MNNKIYLVTGAAGLLGSNITKQLIEKGEEVRALVLPNDKAVVHVPSDAKIILGDITDDKSMTEFFDVDIDKEVYVIHCASIVTIKDEYNQKVLDVNVGGTKKVVDYCVKNNVKKLVYISSTSAIPELPHGQKISEVSNYSEKGIIGFYGQTKAKASQVVMDAVKEFDLDASIVFPSGICGPNDFANGPVSEFIIDYVNGKMPAGVEGFFNAVDVRDLAEGCIACTEKGRKGEGYIMANELVTIQEMFSLVSKITGCKEVKTIIPASFGKAMGKGMDVVGKITGKPMKMTSFAIYNLARNNNFSIKKAEKELGFKTRPFEETIKDELDWMQEDGLLNWK